MDITHIHKLLETCRMMPLGHRDFIISQFTDPYLVFLILVDVKVSPELHRYAPSKWLNWRLTGSFEMVYFSKHSCIVLIEIQDKDTGISLITCKNKYVYVNGATRRTDLALPDWVQKTTAHRTPVAMNDDTAHMVPEDAFTHPYTVQYSDLDGNMHSNNVVYIRVCIDAASFACKNGNFRIFKDSMYHYDVCETSSYFKKESLAGDTLMTFVWEDEKDNSVLHFVVKRDGQELYTCKMAFQIPIKSKY